MKQTQVKNINLALKAKIREELIEELDKKMLSFDKEDSNQALIVKDLMNLRYEMKSEIADVKEVLEIDYASHLMNLTKSQLLELIKKI